MRQRTIFRYAQALLRNGNLLRSPAECPASFLLFSWRQKAKRNCVGHSKGAQAFAKQRAPRELVRERRFSPHWRRRWSWRGLKEHDVFTREHNQISFRAIRIFIR